MAAFLARTIMESNPDMFSLDQELTTKDLNKLIALSIDRLCEKDSPSLETLKMQVGFDMCYVKFEEDLSSRTKTREDDLREMQRAIISVKPRSATDFETLTALYRQIFNYLLSYYDDGKVQHDRNVEREVPRLCAQPPSPLPPRL